MKVKWWHFTILKLMVVFGTMAWIYFFPNSEIQGVEVMTLNETEQGIFAWGLDFLEMQRKNLKSMNKDFSITNKYELEHISTQILLLDKFIKLIKNKTVLTPWENDPKAQ